MTITTNKDSSTELMKICGKFKLNVVKRTLDLNLNPGVVVVAEVVADVDHLIEDIDTDHRDQGSYFGEVLR